MRLERRFVGILPEDNDVAAGEVPAGTADGGGVDIQWISSWSGSCDDIQRKEGSREGGEGNQKLHLEENVRSLDGNCIEPKEGVLGLENENEVSSSERNMSEKRGSYHTVCVWLPT